MSQIDPVSTTGQTATPGAAAKEALLGKDDFLKLLVTQLQHQDPLSPLEDKEFVAQMAQFSSLEQLGNVAGSMERLTHSGQVAQSVGLIGREVEYAGEDGEPLTGVVASVSFVDGEILLHVGDDELPPEAITKVTEVTP
jgi:flagellar basal-body rod modification protein FlgD